jgi:hypothetical protein
LPAATSASLRSARPGTSATRHKSI